MRKITALVILIVFSESLSAGLNSQVGYFLRANGENSSNREICSGSATISNPSHDRKTTLSRMTQQELMEKINDNYMSSMGFVREAEKELNGYKVIRFKSTEIYKGYLVLSLKEIRNRAVICSISYKA